MLAGISRWFSALIVLVGLCTGMASAAPVPTGPLVMVRMGDTPVALPGPWQFHLGDDRNWADPRFPDSDWQQLSAITTWARQGHFSYTGYAWYRLHVQFEPELDASRDIALLVPRIDDVYELYWNGVLVGHNGRFPPHPSWPEFHQPPQIFRLGSSHEGVLAIRVWKAPQLSEDTGLRGGFELAPLVGTPFGVFMLKSRTDYVWLRGRQLFFALHFLYGLIGLLMLVAWIRNRKQWQLFWMAAFALTQVLSVLFYELRLPWSVGVAGAVWQPFSAFRTVSLSFLLLWLLHLRENQALVKLVRVWAWIGVSADTLDGLTYFLIWKPGWTSWVQIGDALLTGIYMSMGMLPLVLVAAAISRREPLDKTRWMVAICAFLSGMVQIAGFAITQGSRFTHWTIGEKFDDPLVVLFGNEISIVTLSRALVLLASAFAVYRSFEENRRRQQGLQLEFENARALQQVLVPEQVNDVPGYRMNCVYRPALQVGGDFFQVVPVEGRVGSTFVLVGDVSGKGLRAAMAVSFILGTVRALAKHVSSPADLLAQLNQHLAGRLGSGFATCIVVRLDPNGRCAAAGAGHPPPYIDGREVHLEGAFPLGLFAQATYHEVEFTLNFGEICTLYTDGLTESRNKAGDLFGEERMAQLLSSRPSVQKIADAAIEFGQDDDITVVSFRRLETEEIVLSGTDRSSVQATVEQRETTPAAIG